MELAVEFISINRAFTGSLAGIDRSTVSTQVGSAMLPFPPDTDDSQAAIGNNTVISQTNCFSRQFIRFEYHPVKHGHKRKF
jgi:hypothetical protein